MSSGTPAPARFYVFYLHDQIEGDHVYNIVLDNDVPHRLQKFQESAYAGAMSLNRDWGKLYIPEPELDRFMELTGNRLAPEVELHVDGGGSTNRGCLGFLMGK